MATRRAPGVILGMVVTALAGGGCVGAGGGEEPECASAVTCPAPTAACKLAVCVGGSCGFADAGDDTSCDDGNADTAGDVCTGGVCAGVDHCPGVTCAPLDQCHDAGVCVDHATGACSAPAKADDTSCDDGDADTTGDACTDGVCAGVDHCLGVTCAPLDQCHDAGVCVDHATGACSNPVMPAGTSCGPDRACDDAGQCFGEPTVIATSPADGDAASADTPVSVTFDQPMDASTLRGQTTIGPCQGTINMMVLDGGVCSGFTSGQPEMSADGRTATFTPAPGLLVNRRYRFRVIGARGVNGLSLLAEGRGYYSRTGFLAQNPLSGSGSSQNESDGPGEVAYCAQALPDPLDPLRPPEEHDGHRFVLRGWVRDERYATSYETLVTQFGYGPTTVNPQYEAGWVWTTAAYQGMVGADAEYAGLVELAAAETYAAAFRVSLDGGTTWTYCDLARYDGGAGSDPVLTFDFENLSVLVSH